jgi:glycosyltransferase involved in cell wall biosynthesis
MNILVIADPHIPVPPQHYGGAERIVALYARAFQERGHRVHLLAGAGSQPYGGRLHLHRAPTMAWRSRARRKIQFQLQSLWAARDADVIYNHGRFDYLEALLLMRRPLLSEFHNPIDQAQINFAETRIRSPRVAFQLISDLYRPGEGAGGYLAFLGRLTANKGLDTALEVAEASGRSLVIAGTLSRQDDDEAFFRHRIEPRLDGVRFRWIGPVNDLQKHALLADAAALLFPIRWPEPFGIVMVEALACGTPVIATRCGSTPEVIEHGRTGFLCDNTEELVAAVGRLGEISRAYCRAAAEQRFDVNVVAPQVLAVLQDLAGTTAAQA